MKSHLRVTPLSGSRSPDLALCHLLEVDDARILLDLGWSPSLNPSDPHLARLAQIAPTLDAVLLSHGSLRHCGAVPYAVRKLGLKCPIYATFPVQTMARHAVVDAVKSRDMNVGGLPRQRKRRTRRNLDRDPDPDHDPDDHPMLLDVDALDNDDDDGDSLSPQLLSKRDIESVFSTKLTLLRYSQPFILSGKAQGTVITAFAAGHTVGGTLWKIKKDTEDIVYAADLNHRKDAHLSPTSLFVAATDSIHPALLRPSLLIASARLPSGISAKSRDAALFSSITATLHQGGNVLIPTDTSSRVLELAHILEDHWHTNGLAYPVVVVSHVAPKVMYHARGMLEWYADQLTKNFASRRVHAFDFTYVKLAGGWTDLRKYPDPKVVLATDPDMDFGFARKVFVDSCNGSARNLVILTRKPPRLDDNNLPGDPTSLAAVLYQSVVTSGRGGTAITEEVLVDRKAVALPCESRVALAGVDLDKYWDRKHAHALAKRAERHAARRASTKGANDVDDEDDQDNEDAGNPDGKSAAQHSTTTPTASSLASDPFTLPVAHFSASAFDAHVRNLARPPRFPYVEHWRRFDEYGEVVKHEQYLTDADRIEKEREAAARRRAEMAAELDGGGGESSSSEDEDGENVKDEMDVSSHLGDNAKSSAKRAHVPAKIVQGTTTLDLHVRVKIVDVEGLADADALAHILPKVQARAIALVGGSASDTDVVLDRLQLAISAQRDVGPDAHDAQAAGPELFAPETGAVVEPQSASYAAAQVKLTDALFTRIKMVKYGEHEIGVITAAIKGTEGQVHDVAMPAAAADTPVAAAADVEGDQGGNDAMDVDEPHTTNEQAAAVVPAARLVPVLDVVDAMHSQRHPSVVIGTVRLTDFKSVLDEQGFATEFVRGILVVNGKVGVYKRSNGHITVEGQVCPEFCSVRKLLYEQHVTF